MHQIFGVNIFFPRLNGELEISQQGLFVESLLIPSLEEAFGTEGASLPVSYWAEKMRCTNHQGHFVPKRKT